MKKKIKLTIIIFIIFQSHSCQARTDEPNKADQIGNFFLPTSQQPRTLFGFGQNIVDQNDLLFFTFFEQGGGKNRNITNASPGLLYGIRDNLVMFATIPFTLTGKYGPGRSRGINDTVINAEYAFLSKRTKTNALQGTIVGTITLPTGSTIKTPNTGIGSPSFFLGTTLTYTNLWWSAWIGAGGILTTTHHQTKFGNQVLYQGGIERYFATYAGWFFAGMVDLFGIYEQKAQLHGVINNNSGGNTFWIGPSIFISSESLIIQLGVAAPAAQHLFGVQYKNHYLLTSLIAYKF